MIKSNGINSLLKDEKTIDFFLKAFLEYQNFPVYSTGFTVVDFDQANHNGKIDNERFDYLYVVHCFHMCRYLVLALHLDYSH